MSYPLSHFPKISRFAIPAGVASAAVVALISLSAGAAAAQGGGWGFGGGFGHGGRFGGGEGGSEVVGTVATAPSGNDFTITTASGSTVTVDTSSSTTYSEHKMSGPSNLNIVVGDEVIIYGTESGSTITANSITVWAPGTAPVVAGTVATAPSGDSFTVTQHSGSTITVDVVPGTTTYSEKGVTNASLTNVTVGSRVVVFGTLSGTTASATQVTIAPARKNGLATEGTVQTAPSSGSFTVQTQSGSTVTVDYNGSTTYKEPGVTNATISDVGVGDRVGIIGTTSGSSVTATEVLIGAPKPTASFAAAGSVESTPSGGSFTIKTFSGSTLTVDYNGSTTYEDFGVTNPTISNVTTDEFVAIFGTESGSTVTANEIIVGGGGHGGRGGFFGFGHGRGFGAFGQAARSKSSGSAIA